MGTSALAGIWYHHNYRESHTVTELRIEVPIIREVTVAGPVVIREVPVEIIVEVPVPIIEYRNRYIYCAPTQITAKLNDIVAEAGVVICP